MPSREGGSAVALTVSKVAKQVSVVKCFRKSLIYLGFFVMEFHNKADFARFCLRCARCNRMGALLFWRPDTHDPPRPHPPLPLAWCHPRVVILFCTNDYVPKAKPSHYPTRNNLAYPTPSFYYAARFGPHPLLIQNTPRHGTQVIVVKKFFVPYTAPHQLNRLQSTRTT